MEAKLFLSVEGVLFYAVGHTECARLWDKASAEEAISKPMSLGGRLICLFFLFVSQR